MALMFTDLFHADPADLRGLSHEVFSFFFTQKPQKFTEFCALLSLALGPGSSTLNSHPSTISPLMARMLTD